MWLKSQETHGVRKVAFMQRQQLVGMVDEGGVGSAKAILKPTHSCLQQADDAIYHAQQ